MSITRTVLNGSAKFVGTFDLTSATTTAASVTATGFRLSSTTTNGLVLTSSGGDGTATWAATGSPAPGSDIIASDNSATGLIIRSEDAAVYMTFDTTDGAEQILFGQDVAFGANAVSGSNFGITGGTVTGLTSLQLTTGAVNGYYAKSNASGNVSWGQVTALATGTGLVATDNSATGLQITASDAQVYMTFDTTNSAEQIIFGQDVAFGANAVSGSNVSITGGSATGLTAFQLDIASAAAGRILSSTDIDGNTVWIDNVASAGASGVIQVSDGSGDFAAATGNISAGTAVIQNLGAPVLGTDAATKQYVDDTALDVSGGVGLVQLSNGSGNLTSDTTFYFTDGTNTLTVEKLVVTSQFTSQGTNFVSEATNSTFTDNIVVYNQGELNVGVTLGTSGFEIDRGPITTNAQFVWRESDGAFVGGLIGALKVVAYREDSPTSNGLAYWDNANTRFSTTLTPSVTSLTATTSLRLDTTTTNGLVLTSSGANGTAVWAETGSPAAGSDIIATDNSAAGLVLRSEDAAVYITLNTTNGSEQVVFGQNVAFGNKTVSGSAIAFTGGTISGLTALQLTTGATNGYYAKSDASGNVSWGQVTALATGTGLVATDNSATGLQITSADAAVYMTFDTTDTAEQIIFGQDVSFGSNAVSGSNFGITGGTATGLTSLQLTTGAVNGYYAKSDASGNVSWGQVTALATGTGLVATDNSATGLQITSADAAVYMTFDTTNSAEQVIFGQDVAFGANAVSGSNFGITGGTLAGITSFQLTTTPTAGYVLQADGVGNGTWQPNTTSGWTDDGTIVRLTSATDTIAIGTASMSGTEKLRVLNGSVLFDGTTGAVPTSGAGTRAFWAGAKSATRFGVVSGTQWDNANVGTSSFAAGSNVTASGTGSTAFGSGATASATNTFAAGNGTTASTQYATAFGNASTASGDSSFAAGDTNTASGDAAVALGDTNTASGAFSMALGYQSQATRRGQWSWAAGNFASIGDAMTCRCMMRRQTTDATANTELTLDGAAPSGTTNRFVLENLTTYFVTVYLVSRTVGTANDSRVAIYNFAIDRQGTAISTAFVGPQEEVVYGNDSGWLSNVFADTTNGALQIRVTGEALKNINWVASLEWTQIRAAT